MILGQKTTYMIQFPCITLIYTFDFLCLCSDQQIQSERREYQQTRAAPVYEDLDAARRRILENDPNRVRLPVFLHIHGFKR